MIHGWWFDGESAQRHSVEVRVAGPSLLLVNPDTGYQLLELQVRNLRLAEEVYPDQPLRLRTRDLPDARLVIEDHGIMDSLPHLTGSAGSRYLGRWRPGPRFVLVSGLCLSLMLGLVMLVPATAGYLATRMPASMEQELGRRVVNSATDDWRQCSGNGGVTALDGLLQRIVQANDLSHHFDVRVYGVKEINAFAAPGGYIVLYRGLLDEAENADEIAGVLAHEMAHVLEQHSLQALGRKLGMRFVLSTLVGDVSSAAALAGQVGEELMHLSYSREAELEADRLALELLAMADINSAGLSTFFQRMQTKDRKRSDPYRLLHSHPTFAERLEHAEGFSFTGGPAMSDSDWQGLKTICETENRPD